MPVDYSKGPRPAAAANVSEPKTAATDTGAAEPIPAYIDMSPKPTVEQVFLALLHAHTLTQGGIKYWRVPQNAGNTVPQLKQMAEKIVEAY